MGNEINIQELQELDEIIDRQSNIVREDIQRLNQLLRWAKQVDLEMKFKEQR